MNKDCTEFSLESLEFPEPLKFHETYLIQDPSKIQQYMDCPRQYFYRYILGWIGDRPSHDLIFGEAWHRAIGYCLVHGFSDEAIVLGMTKFLDFYRDTFSEDTDIDYSPKNPGAALITLKTYAERVNTVGEDFEVVKGPDDHPLVEVHGAVPLLPTFLVTMRIDAICRFTTGAHEGKYFILEHKTTKRLDAKWMRQWFLSMQVFTYIHALHCIYGHENVYGAIVNGAWFKKSYKAEESPIVRVNVWRNYEAVQAWYSDAVFWLESILNEFKEIQSDSPGDTVMTAFPRNTQSCNKYFGCPYYDFCLAWPNPLKNCMAPPPGFKQEFWDPRKREEEIDESVHIEITRPTTEEEDAEPNSEV